jgi:hypothetical protein
LEDSLRQVKRLPESKFSWPELANKQKSERRQKKKEHRQKEKKKMKEAGMSNLIR